MNHVMIDLETMGLKPDAAIVSIGACQFDKTDIGRTFHTAVSLSSCMAVGMSTDPSTVEWWSKQDAEVRAAWQTAGAPSLLSAMTAFSEWMRQAGPDVRPWGNGADFDLVLLTSAYRVLVVDPPWKYYNVRCFRTVKGLFKVGNMPRLGAAHHALDDAVHQAKHLQRILQVHRIELS